MDSNSGKKYIDLSYLRSVSKGNISFEQKMLHTFIHQAAGDIEKLKNALAGKDWETVHLIAHKMKPTIQFIGLHTLQSDVHTLEAIAKQHADPHKITELISNISTQIGIAIEEVKAEILPFDGEKE
jgi:HPt (histidine-containing phosphotransfer) domain-containing protein